ncbi:hypothetical protein HBN54_003575 [Hymenobacter sp. 1B]|uniref:Lipoprotein n=1 Tax=Hymenobacter artigasi TaxID=2719616 RepID=A0ABX1HL22_9BACT|nr:hypothetical protein [Hymenobacter artigasi]
MKLLKLFGKSAQSRCSGLTALGGLTGCRENDASACWADANDNRSDRLGRSDRRNPIF